MPLFIETIKSLPSLQRPGPVGRDGKRQSSNKIAASTHARILTSGGYINKRRGCAGADKVRTCSHLHVGKNTCNSFPYLLCNWWRGFCHLQRPHVCRRGWVGGGRGESFIDQNIQTRAYKHTYWHTRTIYYSVCVCLILISFVNICLITNFKQIQSIFYFEILDFVDLYFWKHVYIFVEKQDVQDGMWITISWSWMMRWRVVHNYPSPSGPAVKRMGRFC